MKLIKKLAEQMHEELEGAEDYIKCAMKHKGTYKELSDLYYKMAEVELSHAMDLHKHTELLIQKTDVSKINDELLKLMKEIWNEKHECLIKEAAEIKAMIEMYKTT